MGPELNSSEEINNYFRKVKNEIENENYLEALSYLERITKLKKSNDSPSINQHVNELLEKCNGELANLSYERCKIKTNSLVNLAERLILKEKYINAIDLLKKAFTIGKDILKNHDKENLLQKIEDIEIKYHKQQHTREKERIKDIEQLIDDKKYKKALKIANETLQWVSKEIEVSSDSKLRTTIINLISISKKLLIRNETLNIGVKFARILIMELAEICGLDKNTDKKIIIETILEMIEDGSIYAQYFKSSEAVAFDQQENIKNMDFFLSNLDREFEEWKEHEINKDGKIEEFNNK